MATNVSFRKVFLVTALAIALVLAAIRLALPYAVQKALNARLQALPGYTGQVGDVDLSLLSSHAVLEDLQVDVTPRRGDEPLVRVPRVDVDYNLARLLTGRLELESVLHRPRITLSGEQVARMRLGPLFNMKELKIMNVAFPVISGSAEVRDGIFMLKDIDGRSGADFTLRDLSVKSTLASEREKGRDQTGLRSTLSAVTSGNGSLSATLETRPATEPPQFTLDARLDGLALGELDDLTQALAGIDLGSGILDLDVRAQADAGSYVAQVQSNVRDVEVLTKEDQGEGALSKLKEGLVEGAKNLIEGGDEAVRPELTIKGRFDEPDTSAWEAVGTVLWRAFDTAMTPERLQSGEG